MGRQPFRREHQKNTAQTTPHHAPPISGTSELTQLTGQTPRIGAELEISEMNFAFQQLSSAQLCDPDLAVAPKLSSSHLAPDRDTPDDESERQRWLGA